MTEHGPAVAHSSNNAKRPMIMRDVLFRGYSRILCAILVLNFIAGSVQGFSSIRPYTHHHHNDVQSSRQDGLPVVQSSWRRRRSRTTTTTTTLLKSSTSTPPQSQSSSPSSSSEVFDADKQQQQRAVKRSSSSSPTSSSTSQKDDPEWKFFDTARIHVAGGDGGSGCVAFRREKGEARGGPNGGRGGRGGSIWLECDKGLNTLLPLRQRVHVRAKKGRNGSGKNRDGVSGNDILLKVPPGTVVRDLATQKLAGELREHGDTLLVARGGRGGRGNYAFRTPQRNAPKIAERGEPGMNRWLSIELRLLADVGFLGMPNAGKSTLLAAASAAKPKIANYPFTTIVPNLGVCDLGKDGAGLVLCDIPGLIKGASDGTGLGFAFLRHVQRCKVLLHVIDGTSEDPIGDFITINKELEQYDPFLAQKPQVVVLNKMDVPAVREQEEELVAALRQAAGHSRVLSISAATTERVQELMGRLNKFVQAQPVPDLPPPPPEIDLGRAGLEYDSDAYKIESDPSYPGQWRISGNYIEQIARMTHWEYPEAVERFGRQLDALGISHELTQRGAEEGDLVMIDVYDFDFMPDMKNPYIPPDLLERDAERMGLSSSSSGTGTDMVDTAAPTERPWRPFRQGGFLDIDADELDGFGEDEDWETLEYNDMDMEGGDDNDDGGGSFVDFEADFAARGDDDNDDDDDDVEVWTSGH